MLTRARAPAISGDGGMMRHMIFVLAVFVCSIGTCAQNPPPHHQLATPNVIDGAVHPELVPDSLAYRLYFVALSVGQNPTEAEQNRQRAQLMNTGLVDTDQQTFITIVSDFKAKYGALVNEYNDSAKAATARNETTDAQTLLKKLDDLVQATRDTISARLSSRGAAKLHSFVMSEKRNMKVTED
jgi:hypothetical protein